MAIILICVFDNEIKSLWISPLVLGHAVSMAHLSSSCSVNTQTSRLQQQDIGIIKDSLRLLLSGFCSRAHT